MSNFTFTICSEVEKESVIEFLVSIGAELGIDSQKTAEEIVNFTFAKGGIVASYADDNMVGLGGYLRGEPSLNFVNQDVGFVYLAAVKREHRLSSLFPRGLKFTVKHLQELGLKELRLHARESDPYTNRLYAHFAKPIRKEPNIRGVPCILYGCPLDTVVQYASRR